MILDKMEKKEPIPADMLPCLETYFGSKEYDDDLTALFEEVQQIEHESKPDKAAAQAESSTPSYSLASVVVFFQHAIEDTDECKDIISKIRKEDIEAMIYDELDQMLPAGWRDKPQELGKRQVVEVFRRMIGKQFDMLRKEYPSLVPAQKEEDVKDKGKPAEQKEAAAAPANAVQVPQAASHETKTEETKEEKKGETKEVLLTHDEKKEEKKEEKAEEKKEEKAEGKKEAKTEEKKIEKTEEKKEAKTDEKKEETTEGKKTEEKKEEQTEAKKEAKTDEQKEEKKEEKKADADKEATLTAESIANLSVKPQV